MSSNIGAIVAVNTAIMNRAVILGSRATEDKRRKGPRLFPGETKADPNPGYGAESFSFHVTCYKYR